MAVKENGTTRPPGFLGTAPGESIGELVVGFCKPLGTPRHDCESMLAVGPIAQWPWAGHASRALSYPFFTSKPAVTRAPRPSAFTSKPLHKLCNLRPHYAHHVPPSGRQTIATARGALAQFQFFCWWLQSVDLTGECLCSTMESLLRAAKSQNPLYRSLGQSHQMGGAHYPAARHGRG